MVERIPAPPMAIRRQRAQLMSQLDEHDRNAAILAGGVLDLRPTLAQCRADRLYALALKGGPALPSIRVIADSDGDDAA